MLDLSAMVGGVESLQLLTQDVQDAGCYGADVVMLRGYEGALRKDWIHMMNERMHQVKSGHVAC